MRNFFEKKDTTETAINPFAVKTAEKKESAVKSVYGKRLDITDTEILNNTNYNSEIEFLEIKMDNIYRAINQNPQTLDPVSLEKMKIEWEELREKLYKMRNEKKPVSRIKHTQNFLDTVKSFFKNFSKVITLIKMYSPTVKQIMNTFNEINKEVEDLVKRTTPQGEEEIKYGLLVNKIYQASKLNGKITNVIK